MNSRISFSSIVFLLAALAASIILSSKLAKARAVDCVTVAQGQSPMDGGLGKFISHINWMRLIQLRGTVDTMGGDKAAGLLAKKYNEITDHDPMFAAAYEEGALDLGWQNPQESLNLLDKAMRVSKLNDWKIPFMAGFIAKTRLKDPARAIAYVEESIKHPDCPGYVQRYLINLKSEVANGDPMVTLNLWTEYYEAGRAPKDSIEPRMGRGVLRPRIAMRTNTLAEADRHMALTRISQLSSKIIADAQAAQATEKEPGRKKELQDKIDNVGKIVNQVYGGIHICSKCFRPFSAGDNFCVFDGTKLQPYGTCPKDGTVTRDAYCQKCGTKVN